MLKRITIIIRFENNKYWKVLALCIFLYCPTFFNKPILFLVSLNFIVHEFRYTFQRKIIKWNPCPQHPGFFFRFFFFFFFLTVLGLSCGVRVCSRGARGLSCLMACGILGPWPGIEPASPPLEGKFFTTGPWGNSAKTQFEGDNIIFENYLIMFFPS